MTAQVLSVHTARPSEFGHPMDPSMSAPTGDSKMSPQTPSSPTSRDDPNRGRRRTRENETPGEDGDANDDGDGNDPGGSSRKRRRSRKGTDKKFDCPHEGCGKSYSRAEHLYRHQLNHNPKQIYHCDFPECNRSFVRQDLCARHKERHTARGSQLLRKDTFMHNLNPIVSAAMGNKNVGKPGQGTGSPTIQLPNERYVHQGPASAHPGSMAVGHSISPPMNPTIPSPASDSATIRPSSSFSPAGSGHDNAKYDSNVKSYGSYGSNQRQPSFSSLNNSRPGVLTSGHDSYNRSGNNAQTPTPSGMPSYSSTPAYGAAGAHSQGYTSTPQNGASYSAAPSSSYQSNQNLPQFNALPPPGFPAVNQAPAPSQQQPQQQQQQQQQPGYQQSSDPHNGMSAPDRLNNVSEAALMDGSLYAQNNQSMPMFGEAGYSRSPFAMADDFAAWLFNDSNFGPGQMGFQSNAMPGVVGSSANIGLQAPYFNYDPQVSGYYTPNVPPSHPMAVNSILDTTVPETALSDDKRQRLIDIIETRFHETDDIPVTKQKKQILADQANVLSLNMMQTYIGSYWLHFHPQMPILHRPTFNAVNTPDLLLLTMITLGASCLEKRHGKQMTSASAELSNFLAWHLRWELFMDKAFRPPAKLWIFQALLLLEIFEKMFSTRPLHERAHIHHATTLTLMRRGSSLIGRAAMESPPSVKDGARSNGVPTPDEWWNTWVTNEATRRAAFAAFLMDSIHATMFGHSAVMVAHEMRLPLPCDEALWSATSGAEVGRVEMSLHSNGVKPTTFLEGLKKTLNGQSVTTNSFGRTILMAGLLSVSWHMNQRDLQVSSLGVSQALGGRDKWRGSLTRAFDFWKQDFDASLAKTEGQAHHGPTYSSTNALDDDLKFESRAVLHHLAHMAMHVDIVDCQIYAGANRLLGRSITPQDSNGAQRRMKEAWAPTARARDATFYALRFLSQVLIPQDRQHINSSSSTQPQPVPNPDFVYCARDDFLLNRPWVLYFALLIVWSYGYALDGPCTPAYPLHSVDDEVKDMQGYLRRLGTARAPDDLQHMTNRNACLGLLMLMVREFKGTRWELLHEASKRLMKCVELLGGETRRLREDLGLPGEGFEF